MGHMFFFAMGEKNNMSQKLEKGTEMDMKTIPLLLHYVFFIIPNLPENIPYVLFREDFVSTWDVCFFLGSQKPFWCF